VRNFATFFGIGWAGDWTPATMMPDAKGKTMSTADNKLIERNRVDFIAVRAARFSCALRAAARVVAPAAHFHGRQEPQGWGKGASA